MKVIVLYLQADYRHRAFLLRPKLYNQNVIELTMIIYITLVGALIGSFANVVIYRLPAGRSVVWPRSSCPNCQHTLSPLELVPVFSWLLQGRKCKSCSSPIAWRYPMVELLMAIIFFALVMRFPIVQSGFTVIPLLIVFAMMLMMSFIDLDHKILPDSLTLPAIVIGLIGTFIYQDPQLPTFTQALFAGSLGAGIIAMINRIGSLVLRRFKDTKELDWPLGMDQVNVAALGGALGGWVVGVTLAVASLITNIVTKKSIRLGEGILYLICIIALLVAGFSFNPFLSPLASIQGFFVASGVVAIVGSFVWWIHSLIVKIPEEELIEDDFDEPIAMGFGDVKLAALMGVVLGWEKLIVAILLAVFIGAFSGIIGRFFGGDRQIPFGPYLMIGCILALFFGDAIAGWYLGAVGF